MRVIKHAFLGFIAVAIIVAVGFTIFKKVQEYQIAKVVKSGLIVVDQELHKWNMLEEHIPFKIEMYVRNNSKFKINGTIVFLVTLDRKGLEKSYIEEVIGHIGEEEFKKYFEKAIAEKRSLGKLESIYNYILRGRKLPEGQEYEPVKNANDKNYIFKFRKQVLFHPGELLKIDHEEHIPLNERGHLLSIKVEDIEF